MESNWLYLVVIAVIMAIYLYIAYRVIKWLYKSFDDVILIEIHEIDKEDREAKERLEKEVKDEG